MRWLTQYDEWCCYVRDVFIKLNWHSYFSLEIFWSTDVVYANFDNAAFSNTSHRDAVDHQTCKKQRITFSLESAFLNATAELYTTHDDYQIR